MLNIEAERSHAPDLGIQFIESAKLTLQSLYSIVDVASGTATMARAALGQSSLTPSQSNLGQTDGGVI